MNVASSHAIVENIASPECKRLIEQLKTAGLTVQSVSNIAEGVAEVRRVKSASGSTLYIQTKAVEWSVSADGAQVDFAEALRNWAAGFPELIDELKQCQRPNLIFVSSDAAWGQKAPLLSSYAAWMTALTRNIDEVSGETLRGNTIIAQRGDLTWQPEMVADLIAWLAERDVSGQEFDLSAPKSIGVVRW